MTDLRAIPGGLSADPDDNIEAFVSECEHHIGRKGMSDDEADTFRAEMLEAVRPVVKDIDVAGEEPELRCERG